jgi:Uma2 family endonuclease
MDNPGYGKLAPDLAAEVVSPSQYRPEMADKAKRYLDRGVRLVWIIWPQRKEVDVWRSTSLQAPVATLRIVDSLDGYDVVPGFTCPLADLFK